MAEKINAEVLLGFNYPGEPTQQVQFTSDKVSLLNLEGDIMVLSIVADNGMNITVKFNKDGV